MSREVMEKYGMPVELTEFIREEAEKDGYQLVDTCTRGGKGFFLEIVIDKKGGITSEECGNFNRKVMFWIDEKGLFYGRYTLDVCSPGLDRPLKSDNDYLWALGKEIEVYTHQVVDSKIFLKGKLINVDIENSCITIEETSGKNFCIERSNVASARLWASV